MAIVKITFLSKLTYFICKTKCIMLTLTVYDVEKQNSSGRKYNRMHKKALTKDFITG